jgi:SNF2 family DNA or RNA helicase
MITMASGRMLAKPGAAELVANMMRPSVRYTLDEIMELPDCIHQTVTAHLTPEVESIYRKLFRHAQALLKDGVITAANAGLVTMKLLQVCAGWVYADDGATRSLSCEPRFRAMLEAVQESAGKVIVFSHWKAPMQPIVDRLAKESTKAVLIHGEVSFKRRTELLDRFRKDPYTRVLVAHPQTMAHGLTLTEANTIVWWGPTPSLELYEQANARIRRPGQTRTQLIVHLEGSATERRIYSVLRQRQAVQDAVLDLLAERNPE